MLMMNELAKIIHAISVEHGWWEKNREFPEVIALAHSELSEALEEYRIGRPQVYYDCMKVSNKSYICDGIKCKCKPESFACQHDPLVCVYRRKDPKGIAIELCDCIIRILDYLESANVDIDAAINTKIEYNRIRPYRHGGKVC